MADAEDRLNALRKLLDQVADDIVTQGELEERLAALDIDLGNGETLKQLEQLIERNRAAVGADLGDDIGVDADQWTIGPSLLTDPTPDDHHSTPLWGSHFVTER